MTRLEVAAFVTLAHALDAATLLAVLPLSTMAGEYGLGASLVYPLAGLPGVMAVKAAGVGLAILLVGSSKLRLSIAVAAGLLGALVNAAAYAVLQGGM